MVKNKTIGILCMLVSFGLTWWLTLERTGNENITQKVVKTNEALFEPGDQFFMQRAWPDQQIDFRAYESSLNAVAGLSNLKVSTLPGFGGSWSLEGPSNIGGRINCILVDPANSTIRYVGCATGGIFKSTNAGLTWNPVFDAQPFLSIGCMAFEPGNSNTIFAGTGDPNISGYPFVGNGIWKSTDGGITWVNKGLIDQRIISKIVIDPQNVNMIYAATMGLPFERNNDRGLYKSTDGGNSWNQILFISNDAGIIDLVMDPLNPDVLFAAGWNRIRNNQESVITGQAAKIYKTTDGGANWTILTNGLPQNDMSRIGLAISKTNSNKIYAVYVNDQLSFDGIYKSIDGGNNWVLQPSTGLDPFFMSNFGWYFGRIEVNPIDDEQLYVCGVDVYRSDDGANSWVQADPNFGTHADKHDVFFTNTNSVLLATDGGLYETSNGGLNWNDAEDIPVTQFYRVTSNPFAPGNYAGGAQDNGTVSGDASSLNNWQHIFGGDGFTMIYDPTDPLIYYVETQNGDIWATADGGVFVDYISGTIDQTDRRNWDMQYILSSHDHNVLYTGTYRIYKNTSGPVDDWTPISPDLTDGIVFEPRFHTISAIAESPVNADYIYAGTSDGNVWRTTNGGSTWDNITGTLPDRYITSVKASPVNQDELFVTVSGYKYNENLPHLFKSVNNGLTWIDISGNLPQLAVNDILIYPANTNFITVATDGGVYATIDGGVYWERVGGNMPIMPVYDIELDANNNKIVAGTFARSISTYSVDSLLLSSALPSIANDNQIKIYPVPAIDHLVCEMNNAEPVEIDIYNSNGALMKSQKFQTVNKFQINISNWKAGIYFMKVRSGNGKISVKKFSKI